MVEPRRIILSLDSTRLEPGECLKRMTGGLLALIDGCQFLSMRTREVSSLPHQSVFAESRI